MLSCEAKKFDPDVGKRQRILQFTEAFRRVGRQRKTSRQYEGKHGGFTKCTEVVPPGCLIGSCNLQSTRLVVQFPIPCLCRDTVRARIVVERQHRDPLFLLIVAVVGLVSCLNRLGWRAVCVPETPSSTLASLPVNQPFQYDGLLATSDVKQVSTSMPR